MRQIAPDPTELFDLVEHLSYRPGWLFALEDMQRDEDHGRGTAEGLTFVVTTDGVNAYHHEQNKYRVNHYFSVPAATYNRQSWQRWIFEQLLLVERHEAMEFFHLAYETPNKVGIETLGTVSHSERPFAPNHGPGWDPYLITEVSTATDKATSFRGTASAG